ncbi:MAG TPA: hypothetical protein H9909_16610 [Candidatus Mediterraneibacter norfolkensis]|nr:hypothetical protein [Candidatus Mediterraneibacter norfolkensis]
MTRKLFIHTFIQYMLALVTPLLLLGLISIFLVNRQTNEALSSELSVTETNNAESI